MLNATIAARRLLSRLRGDATDPEPPVRPASRPGLAVARRADAALRAAAHRPRTVRHDVPAARPARGPVAFVRRLEAPERLVPALVAALLLVASVTAVPGLAGSSTGGTSGAGAGPRIAVGGEIDPFAAAAFGPNDGFGVVDPGIGLDETAAQVLAGQEASVDTPDVTGQFLADGTLLKPVVVETTVEDGSDKLRRYKVRAGDTLTGIATRHGVSMMTLWWANELKTKDDLKVGQTLVVPPVNGLVVTVKAGDTLASIAAANDVSPERVVKLNSLTAETLVIGQVLILPGARGQAYPTPKPTKRPTVRVATVSRPTTSHPTSRNPSRTTKPPARYNGGAFAWPVAGGYISQYFSYGHPAIDIAGDYGLGIKAAAAGRVIFAGWKNNGGGYQVWISHGNGLSTTYSHMSSVAVGSGRSVGRGSFIGRLGSSGWSTGPHLHFEIWRGAIWSGGSRVNPLAYL